MNEIQRRKKESKYLIWVSKILNEDITNANIKNVSVVDVKLSNDGQDLKVFVLFDKSEKKGIETLNNISGFVRSELAKYDYQSRKIPKITFKIDEVSKSSQRIEELLQQIKSNEGKNE